MKSTLLFVAVLLACTPVHAQAIAPAEAPVFSAWFLALLPVPAADATTKPVARRRRAVPEPRWSERQQPAARPAGYRVRAHTATLLTHDSNAP